MFQSLRPDGVISDPVWELAVMNMTDGSSNPSLDRKTLKNPISARCLV